jgi:predicted membrane protein
MVAKHLLAKNIIIFFNTMVLSQNCKNTLLPNTPLIFFVSGIFFIAERCNRREDKKERGDGTI